MQFIGRGERVNIKESAIPETATGTQYHERESALMIFPNLHDDKVGTFHKVMFASTKGVIFKHVLDSEVEDFQG